LLFHISNKLWTLPLLTSILNPASVSISAKCSVYVVFNSWPVTAKISLLAWANYFTMSVLQRVSLWFFTASCREPLGRGKFWPPLWHPVVWLRICRTPHWRNQVTLSAFHPIAASSL
jgi:hypothetical protein